MARAIKQIVSWGMLEEKSVVRTSEQKLFYCQNFLVSLCE